MPTRPHPHLQVVAQSALLSNYHFDKYLAQDEDAPHFLQVCMKSDLALQRDRVG